MLLVIHDNRKVTKVIKNGVKQIIELNSDIVPKLFDLAKSYPEDTIFWCYEELETIFIYDFLLQNQLNCSYDPKYSLDILPTEILSYNPYSTEFIPDELGYIDFRSPYLNIRKDVKYATWLLSSSCGVIRCKTLLLFMGIKSVKDFNCFLVELGFTAMKAGLFPFSEPKLLVKPFAKYSVTQSSTKYLFKFVRRFYSERLFYFLIFMFFKAQRRIPLWPIINAIFTTKAQIPRISSEDIYSSGQKECTILNDSIDVVIPTLGRGEILRDFMNDLNEQTLLPSNVIIIEQKPSPNDSTDLDYLYKQNWNYKVTHKIIYQLGACNARNVALQLINSNWIFFADDDIRIKDNLFEKTISFLNINNLCGASVASYQKGESINTDHNPTYWGEFSSGCSMVRSEVAKGTFFDMSFEFGFGEDTDYGCQLRNKGCSIIYFNKNPIFHLKAPMGGFRFKFDYPWARDKIQPVPSPSILKCMIKNFNNFQNEGYKWIYILRLTLSSIKNVIRYKQILKQFDRSMFWAEKL